MSDGTAQEKADRALMSLEGMAFHWVTEHGIDKAIDAASSIAGGHAPKLASVIHGLVTQAWIEGADSGFQARKKLHDVDKERAAELEELFDATWAADMRAVDLWRKANPGNDLVLPDRTKLVFWLLQQTEAPLPRPHFCGGGVMGENSVKTSALVCAGLTWIEWALSEAPRFSGCYDEALGWQLVEKARCLSALLLNELHDSPPAPLPFLREDA